MAIMEGRWREAGLPLVAKSMFFGRYAKDPSGFKAAICPAESRQLI